MRTVLGLSKTSTSIGWVLVDGRDADGDTLDHDAFDIDIGEKVSDGSITEPAATARRAQAIATATGYTVNCVRVTWSDHVHTDVPVLRKALAESGFDEVVTVPLAEATKAWAKSIARVNGHEKTAVCILDREAASLSVIDTRNGAVQTATANSRDSAGVIDWLTTVFHRDGWRPESLYLIGSRCDLDAIAGPLDEHLAVQVVASLDAQLVLARGAALSGLKHVDVTATEGRSRLASRVRVITVAAAVAVAAMFVLSSASGPNRLAASESQQAATSSTMATSTAKIPTSADPSPLVFPPPPAAAVQSVPTKPHQATIPAAPAPAKPVAVPSKTLAAPGLATVAIAPPVQHLPEAQPAGVPAPGPVAAEPGPVAPPPAAPGPIVPPAAPIPPPSETIPPPPPDPTAEDLGALLSDLP